MSSMFRNAESFNQPLDSLDVSEVVHLAAIFWGAVNFDQPLGSWNLSSAQPPSHMFREATSYNQDLSPMCVSNIWPQPSDFDNGATSWTLPNSRPLWGQPC